MREANQPFTSNSNETMREGSSGSFDLMVTDFVCGPGDLPVSTLTLIVPA